jgi:hypothetical protein
MDESRLGTDESSPGRSPGYGQREITSPDRDGFPNAEIPTLTLRQSKNEYNSLRLS